MAWTCKGLSFGGKSTRACSSAALVLWLANGGIAGATDLTQKPPQGATTTTFEAGTSTIEPSLSISYNVLADAANAAADRFSGPRSGTTRIGCGAHGSGAGAAAPGCAQFDWHVIASRNGAITAKRDGQGIAMAVPVKFSGNGGFRGDLARAVQMNNKKFNGTFVVTISGVLGFDRRFCPRLEQPVAHFSWGTPPEIDIIGKSCLGASNGPKVCIGPWKFPAGTMLTGQINNALQDQVSAINGKISCNDVRNQLKQAWKTWSIPVTLPNSPTFYANIEPKSLSVPGVQANDDGILVNARLDVASSVSTQKLPDNPQELPDNVPLPTQPGRFSLHVPLAVPYALLAAAQRGFVGKPIKAGSAGLTPTRVAFFPSNDRLAVGVTFRADTPAALRNQTGTVWFTASPAVGDDGHLIRLSNVTMTGKTDSPLWTLSPAIGALPAAIGKAYSYDLAPLVRDARTKLNQALADPRNTGGANIKVANDHLKLGRTALLSTTFAAEGLFDADVSVALQEPHS